MSHDVIDKSFGLPIINAPAHEWVTLVSALNQLTRLSNLVSGVEDKLLVTLDMDLYKKALKLEYLDTRFKDKWILCSGAFHTVRCLGRTIEGSGLDEAWQEADLYSSVTTTQIINGNHHNRALEAHQVTLQVLFDLWIESVVEAHPELHISLQSSVNKLIEACKTCKNVHEAHNTFRLELESMEIEKLLNEYDERRTKDPMYMWTRMYMKQVIVLLQFQRATHTGNWFLYLAALEKICVYFFAYNRLDYAQNIPEYIARMQELETVDPKTWTEFVSGNFTVNTSSSMPFTRIGVDHAMEHQNKVTKGKGGISGITSNPTTLLKFCLTAPELGRFSQEMEHLVTISDKTMNVKHHCLSDAKVAPQEIAIEKLRTVLSKCHIFSSSSNDEDTSNQLTQDVQTHDQRDTF